MRRLKLGVKIVITLIVIAFVWQSFDSARRQLSADDTFGWKQLRWRWLLASGVAYVIGMLPMGGYWYVLISRFGMSPPPLYRTLTAYFVGHLGKYVPGKAMVIVLRAGLLQSEQLAAAPLAVSVFIETFTMMTAGAALATVLIAWNFSQHGGLLVLAAGLASAASLPTWPPLLRWTVKTLRIANWSTTLEAALRNYTWKVMIIGWALELTGWMFLGVSLWAVMQAIPLPPQPSLAALWPRLTASVSLSMVAGFLSLLPGGLGVREVVLDQLLKPQYGAIIAPLSAILLRVVWLLTELVTSSILYGGLRLQRPSRS